MSHWTRELVRGGAAIITTPRSYTWWPAALFQFPHAFRTWFMIVWITFIFTRLVYKYSCRASSPQYFISKLMEFHDLLLYLFLKKEDWIHYVCMYVWISLLNNWYMFLDCSIQHRQFKQFIELIALDINGWMLFMWMNTSYS